MALKVLISWKGEIMNREFETKPSVSRMQTAEDHKILLRGGCKLRLYLSLFTPGKVSRACTLNWIGVYTREMHYNRSSILPRGLYQVLSLLSG